MSDVQPVYSRDNPHPDWVAWMEDRWEKRATLILGDTHRAQFIGLTGHPELERRYCLSVLHRRPNGVICESTIYFDTPEVRAASPTLSDGNLWQVQSWDPLTVSPSLLCMQCNDHGFIREGKWVVA